MWPPFAVLTQLVMSKTHSLGNIGCGCSNMNGIIRSLFWVAHSPVSHWKDKILIRSSTTGHTLISGCYNNIFFIVFVSKMLFVSKASTLECGGCYLLCLLFSFKICYLFIKRLPPFWKTPARSDVLPISLTLPEVIKLGSSFFTLVIESSTSSWMWSINSYNLPFRTYLQCPKRVPVYNLLKNYQELPCAMSFFVNLMSKPPKYVFTRQVWLTIRAKQTERMPLPEPTSRALAPSYSWSCRSSRA